MGSVDVDSVDADLDVDGVTSGMGVFKEFPLSFSSVLYLRLCGGFALFGSFIMNFHLASGFGGNRYGPHLSLAFCSSPPRISIFTIISKTNVTGNLMQFTFHEYEALIETMFCFRLGNYLTKLIRDSREIHIWQTYNLIAKKVYSLNLTDKNNLQWPTFVIIVPISIPFVTDIIRITTVRGEGHIFRCICSSVDRGDRP